MRAGRIVGSSFLMLASCAMGGSFPTITPGTVGIVEHASGTWCGAVADGANRGYVESPCAAVPGDPIRFVYANGLRYEARAAIGDDHAIGGSRAALAPPEPGDGAPAPDVERSAEGDRWEARPEREPEPLSDRKRESVERATEEPESGTAGGGDRSIPEEPGRGEYPEEPPTRGEAASGAGDEGSPDLADPGSGSAGSGDSGSGDSGSGDSGSGDSGSGDSGSGDSGAGDSGAGDSGSGDSGSGDSGGWGDSGSGGWGE